LLPIEVKFRGGTIKEPVAMRSFREAYPGSLAGVMVSRDEISVPGKECGTPLIVPAYLAEHLKWGML
jgi:hypothetical protein